MDKSPRGDASGRYADSTAMQFVRSGGDVIENSLFEYIDYSAVGFAFSLDTLVCAPSRLAPGTPPPPPPPLLIAERRT